MLPLVLGALIFTFVSQCREGDELRADFCRSKKVVDIGGCDRDGYCGVKLDSGEFTSMRNPVVGQKCR